MAKHLKGLPSNAIKPTPGSSTVRILPHAIGVSFFSRRRGSFSARCTNPFKSAAVSPQSCLGFGPLLPATNWPRPSSVQNIWLLPKTVSNPPHFLIILLIKSATSLQPFRSAAPLQPVLSRAMFPLAHERYSFLPQVVVVAVVVVTVVVVAVVVVAVVVEVPVVVVAVVVVVVAVVVVTPQRGNLPI